MDQQSEIYYTIALSSISSVGNVGFQRLINVFGSAENVFKADKKQITKIDRVGEFLANNILKEKTDALKKAEEEMQFIEKNHIVTLLQSDENYPTRLKHCPDAPPILFARGEFSSNPPHCVAIVGTRRCTQYGTKMVKEIVEELAPYHILVISGLAEGIDTAAHQAALDNHLSTIGVLGHGLRYIFPASNKKLAKTMIDNQGGVLTEFLSNTPGDAFNFPRRNRIIAGMADAIIVAEAHKKGGALITADIGFSYDRDIFAFPGKAHDSASEGCNNLIKQNKAALITSGQDVAAMMNWTNDNKKTTTTATIRTFDLNNEESKIINILQERGEVNIDDISEISGMDALTLSSILLTLEFKGYIECLPGKRYHIT